MTDQLPMPDLTGKSVLITGGTGSFGRSVLVRLLETACRFVRIFSRDELKQSEMRDEFQEPRLQFFLGDVRDALSVDRAMQDIDLVFHAAALKQVPSCEFFPMQAVMTNIVGSDNVLRAAVDHGVETVVCLSTDKAVHPINAMGQSKALMEKTMQATARAHTEGGTRVCAVRYGNVMCSRGSVIPLFIRQLKEGKALTLTDPGMTRFMLPLPSAVDLVLFAFEHAEPGDIFVRKAPACTIGDLARALRELFEVEREDEVIGIRHGEKIYETLVTRQERLRSQDLGGYFRIALDDRDLNYNLYFKQGHTEKVVDEEYHSHNAERLDLEGVKELLLSLPEVRAELEG